VRVPGRTWRCIPILVVLVVVLAPASLPRAMVWAQALEPGYWEPSNLPQMGLATYYAPGMMRYVYDYRVQRGQLPSCPECVGAVALLRAGDIGRKVWLQPPGGELAGPFLVVDCARTEDVQPLLDRNWVVDVSYELGQTWALNAPLDGVIVWADPAEGNAPRPSAQPTLFYIDPRDVVISVPTPTPQPVATGALPTRVPVPRAAARVGTPTPQKPAGPPPLTPIITTPTPPGGAANTSVPTALSANLPGPGTAGPMGDARSPAPSTPTVEDSAPVPMRVSFGRPGAGLLSGSASADQSRVLAVPVATPAHFKAPIFPAAAATSKPMVATAAPSTVHKESGQPTLLEQFWDSLRSLFEPGSATSP
jgi:hypothetical protein